MCFFLFLTNCFKSELFLCNVGIIWSLNAVCLRGAFRNWKTLYSVCLKRLYEIGILYILWKNMSFCYFCISRMKRTTYIYRVRMLLFSFKTTKCKVNFSKDESKKQIALTVCFLFDDRFEVVFKMTCTVIAHTDCRKYTHCF